ncbi:hypothetical protein IQ254_10640 [Nodosilinea sp. LEGE 07088]|uniref:hypothetical protein n=1 Tax=Nodosilinea sp. LEGE 07088 TaxID=2777968 RepID=UPI0018808CCD|nr:hypothetical protein [Nodosilinea sp. LEGE 07088]MBE9137666.1 hypothetical protein [Nodosilinea sp. LEGE 07088]
MGNRYSDIKRAARLQTGLNNYINHLQTLGTRPSRIGTQGARNLDVTLYFQPFTASVATDEYVAGRCTTASDTKLRAIVNGADDAAVTNTLGANTLINLPKFRGARVVYFENATRSVNVETSDVTGLQYLKYAGERFSIPFGAQTATADQQDAFLSAKAAILAANASAAVKRVSLSREFIGVEPA